ncbi:hypothetical protein ACIQM2_17385 [Streptomyces lydicus]|uniref:hypothetical protein n=1 Tax=Streptomyces lydicus TaxID=47763 RepID=UPI00380A8821
MTIQHLIKNVAARDLTTFARAIPSKDDHLLTQEGGIIPTLEQDEVKWRIKDNGRYVNVAKYRAFDASVPFASREAWQTTREGMLPPLGQKRLVGEQEQILLEASRGADEDRLIDLLYDDTERHVEAIRSRVELCGSWSPGSGRGFLPRRLRRTSRSRPWQRSCFSVCRGGAGRRRPPGDVFVGGAVFGVIGQLNLGRSLEVEDAEADPSACALLDDAFCAAAIGVEDLVFRLAGLCAGVGEVHQDSSPSELLRVGPSVVDRHGAAFTAKVVGVAGVGRDMTRVGARRTKIRTISGPAHAKEPHQLPFPLVSMGATAVPPGDEEPAERYRHAAERDRLVPRNSRKPATQAQPTGRLTSDTQRLTTHQNERQMSVISASRYRP